MIDMKPERENNTPTRHGALWSLSTIVMTGVPAKGTKLDVSEHRRL